MLLLALVQWMMVKVIDMGAKRQRSGYDPCFCNHMCSLFCPEDQLPVAHPFLSLSVWVKTKNTNNNKIALQMVD